MNIDDVCQSYGLELLHSDNNYTSVQFRDVSGELYNFDFASHMLRGERARLSSCIINTIITLSSEKAKNSLQLELRTLLGL